MNTLKALLLCIILLQGCRDKDEFSIITVDSLQNQLIGTWRGTAVRTGNEYTYNVEFKFYSLGYYEAEVLWVESGEVFMTGDDDVVHPDKKFEIESLDSSNLGRGKVSVVHHHSGLPVFKYFWELKITDNEKLNFYITHENDENHEPYISYSLIRKK